MTRKEQLNMYMKYSKKELCRMLIEANKHLKNLSIVNCKCGNDNEIMKQGDGFTYSICGDCGEEL